MGQTIVEKIAGTHMTQGPTRPLRAGDFVSIRPKHVMTHDNTSAVMKKFHSIGAETILDPQLPIVCLDHDIQNAAEDNVTKYRAIEAFAKRHGIDFSPAGGGIGHQIVVERLYATPGSFVVAADSHANMYGGIGAIGTPVVRTDAAALWATGEIWWQVPPTVQVVLEGELPLGSTGKDVILALCGLYDRGEVRNRAVEFAGPGVATLSLAERLSIANMTTEWGALAGWFPVDEVTLAYLSQRKQILEAGGVRRVTDEDLQRWAKAPPRPDPDAAYDARITLDLATVSPCVSGPDTVQAATPLSQLEAQKIKIHKAYVISCVNSRSEDLEAAARVLRGKKIAGGVAFYVAAASRQVQEDSETSGAWKVLLDAGATVLPPGCGPCIGLGTGVLEAGEVGISAANRNFKGRMGSRDATCYLASPEVVAASAAAGYICGPHGSSGERQARHFERLTAPAAAGEPAEILAGFPETVRGRLVFLSHDDLNTDGIYGKDYTYRDDMTGEEMARVVLANYDPSFASRTVAGDVVVGGFNFGTGSSREQAVTALRSKGIPLVVAGSFSQTYLRNAFNNGYPCIEAPDFVTRLREIFHDAVAAKEKTILPGDEIEVDFRTSTLRARGETFRFAPLGVVPQSLIVAGGVENQVRARLGL